MAMATATVEIRFRWWVRPLVELVKSFWPTPQVASLVARLIGRRGWTGRLVR